MLVAAFVLWVVVMAAIVLVTTREAPVFVTLRRLLGWLAAVWRGSRFVRDLTERVVASFVLGFATELLRALAAGALGSFSALTAAGAAGVYAALSMLKGLAARRLGDPNSAAMLPTARNGPKPPA